MDIFDDELVQLFEKLFTNKVKYILVGGFATNLHGFNRMTGDVDIWLKDDLENRKKFRAALKDMELGDFEAIETMQFLPGWSSINLNSGFELDVMSYIMGFESEQFDACYTNAPEAIILNIPIRFLHLNDLIESKQNSTRTKDILDTVELIKIKNENIE